MSTRRPALAAALLTLTIAAAGCAPSQTPESAPAPAPMDGPVGDPDPRPAGDVTLDISGAWHLEEAHVADPPTPATHEPLTKPGTENDTEPTTGPATGPAAAGGVEFPDSALDPQWRAAARYDLRISFTSEAGDEQVTVRDGCNTHSGSYALEGSELRIHRDTLAGTLAACDFVNPGPPDLIDYLTAAPLHVERYSPGPGKRGTLTLSDGKVTTMWVAIPDQP